MNTYDIAKQISGLYAQELRRQNIISSGNLYRAAQRPVIEKRKNNFTISLNLPSYWEIVEEGRRPGKFPPPSSIDKWMNQRNIPPREDITREQQVYLISRKIAKKGIKGRYPLKKSLESQRYKYLENKLEENLVVEIEEILDDSLIE